MVPAMHALLGLISVGRNRSALMGAVLGTLIAVMIGTIPATAAAQPGPVRSLLEMRHDRVVVQKWDLSCGAAALATILNFQHNDPINEREIAIGLMGREEYVKNPALVQVRQGFSLLDLKRYVDSRGYEGIGYGKLTLEDLIERAPVMVPIDTNGYKHFVVFRGTYGNRVLLADPAWGNRTMTIDKFKRKWLDYPEFGHVGFVVVSTEEGISTGLAPRPDEFVMLR